MSNNRPRNTGRIHAGKPKGRVVPLGQSNKRLCFVMAAGVLMGTQDKAPWWGYFFLALIVLGVPGALIYAVATHVPAVTL